jgi:hypothetical protein
MRLMAVLAIFALLGAVSGQTNEQQQQKGGTIEQMTEALNRNSDVTTHNAQKIDELPSVLENYYKRQTGTIIGGVALFIVLCYLVLGFLDRVRKIKKKKSYEEHIAFLEDLLKEREAALIEVLRENNTQSRELLARCDAILTRQTPEGMDKREIALNIGTLLVGMGLMGLTVDTAKELVFLDNAWLYVGYRILWAVSILIGGRMWLMYYKTEVKK